MSADAEQEDDMAANRETIRQRLQQIEAMKNNAANGSEISTKSLIYDLFNDANSSTAAMWISNLINLVILASTFGFVAETDPELRSPSYSDMWFGIECLCVGLFTVDFIVRAITCPDFKDFRSDIMNAVDFIAIVPFYIELSFKVLELDAGALSNLRVIRVLRLARVLKIIAKSGNDGPSLEDGDDDDVGAVISEIVSNSGGALMIPLYFMLLALIVFASLEYYIEKVNPILTVHHCEDWDDLSTCTRDLPHAPFESPCPVQSWQNEVTIDHELLTTLGEEFGHACTLDSMLFPAGVPDEAEILLADVGVTAGKNYNGATCGKSGSESCDGRWAAGTEIDCGFLNSASKHVHPGDKTYMGPKLISNATGIPVYEHACRVAEYYEFPDQAMGEPSGSIYNADDASSSDMFPSIPHAMWWCIVTMTTVGYGDKYPISWLGQCVGVCTAAMGIFFISMPLAIVGSSFANSCDKLQIVQDQKNAVKAAQESGFAAISFLNKSHAPLLIANNSMGQMINEIQNIVDEDVGAFDKDECADVIDLIFDLREKQTLFSRMLHKELFLNRVKKNMADAAAGAQEPEMPAE